MIYKNLFINTADFQSNRNKIAKAACFSSHYRMLRNVHNPWYILQHSSITIFIEKETIDNKRILGFVNKNVGNKIEVKDALVYLNKLKELSNGMIKKVDNKSNDYIRISVSLSDNGIMKSIKSSDSNGLNEIKYINAIRLYLLTISMIRALYENNYSRAVYNAIIANKNIKKKNRKLSKKINIIDLATYFLRKSFVSDSLHAPTDLNSKPVKYSLKNKDIKEYIRTSHNGNVSNTTSNMEKISEETLKEIEKTLEDTDNYFHMYLVKKDKVKFKEIFHED